MKDAESARLLFCLFDLRIVFLRDRGRLPLRLFGGSRRSVDGLQIGARLRCVGCLHGCAPSSLQGAKPLGSEAFQCAPCVIPRASLTDIQGRAKPLRDHGMRADVASPIDTSGLPLACAIRPHLRSDAGQLSAFNCRCKSSAHVPPAGSLLERGGETGDVATTSNPGPARPSSIRSRVSQEMRSHSLRLMGAEQAYPHFERGFKQPAAALTVRETRISSNRDITQFNTRR